jgi:predicted ATP-dependent endonuclease of OLD family
MHITTLKIKRFKSLLDVELTNLDNLVILIGKNDAGKSNLSESLNLFFQMFPNKQDDQIGGQFEHLWHFDVEPSQEPIEIVVTLDFDDSELPKEGRKEYLRKILRGQEGWNENLPNAVGGRVEKGELSEELEEFLGYLQVTVESNRV